MNGYIPMTRPRRVYDPRLRELVFHTGNVDLARDLGVPRSTANDWVNGKFRDVVTVDVFDKDKADLQAENLKLRRRLRVCGTVVGLLLALLRLSGFRLDELRVPGGDQKGLLLKAIDRSRRLLPLKSVLRVIGLSTSRYHSWCRAEVKCELDDRPSCPRSQPTRLSAEEVRTMHEMAISEDYKHLPIARLALLAQRLGKLFASASTWAKLIRERGWRRPRQRVYPAKAKVGVRACKPDEYWHVDASIIKLLDGTRVYIHAVVDNFSRKVLAWCVAEKLEPGSTVQVAV